jgi:GGDEF domain-containing protein
VAEPLAGHFEQDQLNLLGNLAVRLTSYLRARQQVLEGSLAQPTAEPAPAPAPPEPAPSAYEPMVETPVVAEADVTAPLVGYLDPPRTQFDDLLEDMDDEHPLDRAADTFEPAGVGWGAPGSGTNEPRVDDWEFLGLDEVEWVEAVAPTPPTVAPPLTFDDPDVPGVVAPALRPEAPARFGTRDHQPALAAMPEASDLDAMLGPDPVTGLATLTTLVGRLSASLSHVRNNEGMVGLILFDVSAADGAASLGDAALMTVAGRLTNHLRDRDMVARIGPRLFAVLVDLRPGAVDIETIRQRSVASLTAGIESSTGGLQARSSVASASAGSTVTAEDLLRQAADQLRGR